MSFRLDSLLLKIVDGLYALRPRGLSSREDLLAPFVVAHRGAWFESQLTENTAESFQKALEVGAHALEFDVRWTKDNTPVVHHDGSLQRVFDLPQKIHELSWTELKNLNKNISSLSSVLQRFRGKTHFFIELKEPLTDDQHLQLKKTLDELTPIVDFHVMSLNLKILQSLPWLPPKAMVSIARSNTEEVFRETLAEGWGGFTGHYALVRDRHIKACHEQQIKVGTGFPSSRSVLYRERRRRVDWIFTNHPQKIVSLFNEIQN